MVFCHSEFWDEEIQRDVCGPVNRGNACWLSQLSTVTWNVFNCQTISGFCVSLIVVNGLSDSNSHLLFPILDLTFYHSNFIKRLSMLSHHMLNQTSLHLSSRNNSRKVFAAWNHSVVWYLLYSTYIYYKWINFFSLDAESFSWTFREDQFVTEKRAISNHGSTLCWKNYPEGGDSVWKHKARMSDGHLANPPKIQQRDMSQ